MDELIGGETTRLLLLVKPAGIPVFPPHADPEGDCLLARLRAARPEQAVGPWPDGYDGGLAHRLDTATSGAVLAARTPEDLVWLRGLFAGRALVKTYRFVSARDVPWDSHVVTTALAHDARRKDRMIAQRGADTPHRGRWYPAETRLRRLGRLGGLGIWEARMKSGVMHQIRAHAASVGLALAGDAIYGGGPPPDFAGRPEDAPFLLHHLGVAGPDLPPLPPLPPPAWWPRSP